MSETPFAILYIDDDEGLRSLTRRALELRGFRVLLAENGDEGVAMARAELPDLVAVDQNMPGKDGLQTLSALQKLSPPPPVIFVTGADDGRLAVRALKAGAIDYVVKTASDDYFDLLARSIEQALDTMRLRREHARAELQLRDSNERLQALLKEVNHRVANSLQLVAAFIHMQGRALTDEAARAALEDTQRRVTAIGQVHKRLYTSSSVEAVDMADYLASLVEELGGTWSTPSAPRVITLSADALSLATDKAVAVGVIVTELVTNACKYAYAANAPGEVRVSLAAQGGRRFRLAVEDDGCGFNPAAGAQGTGLGSKLIATMASALKASVEYETGAAGVRAVLLAAG